MKIEVYDKDAKNKTVRLRLVELESGVELQAVDVHGERMPGGTLLVFGPDGTFYRATNVDKKIGLKLDASKRIMLRGE